MFSLVEVFESVFPNARSEECNNITCHICTRFDTYLHSRMLCRTIKSFLQLNWVCHVFLPSTIHLLVVGSKKFILINTFTSRRLNCINYVDQLPWNIHEIMSVPYQKYLTWHNVENVSWQILHLYKIKTTVNWSKTSVSRQFFKQHKTKQEPSICLCLSCGFRVYTNYNIWTRIYHTHKNGKINYLSSTFRKRVNRKIHFYAKLFFVYSSW